MYEFEQTGLDEHHHEPAMPSVYIENLISDANALVFRDNSEASRWLMEQALDDLSGNAITEPTSENNEILTNMMVSEALFALRRADVRTSSNWYTQAIQRMIAVASTVHPEIGSDEAAASHASGAFKNREEARLVLFSAMAITSQNINVADNMRYALEQYRYFLENGKFNPKTYGANGGAIGSNLDRFNFMLSRTNGDLGRLKRVLTMKLTMRELMNIGRKYGIQITGSELADETVYGSMIFGPKVGNGFFQNLMGNHEPVTIDLWFMRMWGRYTGTLIRDEITGNAQERLVQGLRRSLRGKRMSSLLEQHGLKRDPSTISEMSAPEFLVYCRQLKRFWEKIRKRYADGRLTDAYVEMKPKNFERRDNRNISEFKAKLMWPSAAESIVDSLGMPVDMPKNASMRKWIREIVYNSIDKLKGFGYEITASDLQAILWYPEKEIYGKLTGRPTERFNMSYDEVMLKIAKSEGVSDNDITEALRSVGEDRSRGSGNAASAGSSLSRADDGFRGRTHQEVGRTDDRELISAFVP